jgi:tRNA G18 (ribose-2'-O)-methylase SpoU
VGAVIRSAAAFGVSRVVVLKEAAHPFHHKSVRAAGSAILRVSLWEGPSIKELEKTKAPLVSLSPGGKDIARYKFPSTFGLLPGLEGPGLPESLRHTGNPHGTRDGIHQCRSGHWDRTLSVALQNKKE